MKLTPRRPFGLVGIVLGALLGYFGTTFVYGYMTQSNLSGLLGLWLGLPIGAGVGAVIGLIIDGRSNPPSAH